MNAPDSRFAVATFAVAFLAMAVSAVGAGFQWYSSIREVDAGSIAIPRHSWSPLFDGTVELQFWLAVQNSGTRTLVVTQSAAWAGTGAKLAPLFAQDEQLSAQQKWTIVERGKVEMREIKVRISPALRANFARSVARGRHGETHVLDVTAYVVALYPSGLYAQARTLPLNVKFKDAVPIRVEFQTKAVDLTPLDTDKGAPVL